MLKRTILHIILVMLPFIGMAQETTRILFVFDASNSMNGYWERERKIVTATKLLSETLESLANSDNLELGLRVYGHQTKHVQGKQDCDDTELVVSIGPDRNLIIKKELERLTPQGTTPIARSLERAADDFTPCEDCRNIIILITDGIEACDEDPCAVSRALQAKGIILKPFIIGIGIDDKFKSTFECVGNYFDAGKEETFKQVLDIVVTQALNSTSAQINLLDAQGAPTETNLPLSIYNQDNGVLIHNFVHTLNKFGDPDTITLDPLHTYHIEAHTIPPVHLTDVKLKPGEHNIIEIPAAQGDLELSCGQGRSEYADLKCRVTRQGSCEEVNVQSFDTRERYLTGTYDLEIQTIPPMVIQDVEIRANELTPVKIPLPGVLLLQTGTNGFGAVFQMVDNQAVMVHRFTYGESGGRFVLQPGD
ncbi:MAG: VWA domain-containing protein [Flavobacteriales bacterium]|nr:VWA domain-containing protein [Flavobacteriales bacterium]